MSCGNCEKRYTCRSSPDFLQPHNFSKEDELLSAVEDLRRRGLSNASIVRFMTQPNTEAGGTSRLAALEEAETIHSQRIVDEAALDEATKNAADFCDYFDYDAKGGLLMSMRNENFTSKPEPKMRMPSPMEIERAKKQAIADGKRTRTFEAECKIESERVVALAKETQLPINRFISAIRRKNVDSDALTKWVQNTTTEQRKETLAEFENLAARRGLPLTTDDLAYARMFLNFIITSTQPEQQATNFLSRMTTHLKVGR